MDPAIQKIAILDEAIDLPMVEQKLAALKPVDWCLCCSISRFGPPRPGRPFRTPKNQSFDTDYLTDHDSNGGM